MTKHRAQCARGTNVDTIGKKYIWKLIWWLYVSSFYLTLKRTLKPRMPAFCSTWYVKCLHTSILCWFASDCQYFGPKVVQTFHQYTNSLRILKVKLIRTNKSWNASQHLTKKRRQVAWLAAAINLFVKWCVPFIVSTCDIIKYLTTYCFTSCVAHQT